MENTEVKKKGRPVVATSARQIRLTKQAQMRANGVEVKRGRPRKQVVTE